MKKICSIALTAVLTLATTSLLAWDSCCYGYQGYSDPCCQENECCFDTDGLGLYGFYSLGDSAGICQNYGAVGVYYAPCICPCNYTLVADASFLYFNDGTIGGSVGGGMRYLNADDSFVGGVNAFYDYREGNIGDFHQVGVGLEIIGNCFEFRANGYFPICSKVKSGDPVIFDDYDNSATSVPYEVTVIKDEYALTGFDMEGGLRYCCQGFTAYAGIGPYYFERESLADYWGGKARVRAEFGQLLAIEAQVTWDEENKTHGRGRLAINIPLSVFCELCEAFGCPCKSQRRIYRDPVHLDHCCQYTTNYPIN